MPYYESAIWTTPRKAAKDTGVPYPTLHYWLRLKRIPGAATIGKRHLIPVEWVKNVKNGLAGDSEPLHKAFAPFRAPVVEVDGGCSCDHLDGKGVCEDCGQVVFNFGPIATAVGKTELSLPCVGECSAQPTAPGADPAALPNKRGGVSR